MKSVQKTYRFLQFCPICNKEYNEHWKIVNHIRKTKDKNHQEFLINQEKEVFELYKINIKNRYYIKEMLYEKKNMFAGIDYGKIMNILHNYIPDNKFDNIRRKRISATMKTVPKTAAHNKKVSEAVKKAWKDGTFDTEEYKKAKQKGYDKRRSYSGKNNPMYGKPCPKGAGRGKGGIRKDLGFYVRSTWEANIARICILIGRPYKYEPDRFPVVIDGKDYTYCPDIFFPEKNLYYEIKGHAKSSQEWICDCSSCEQGRLKMQAAIKQHGIKILLIGKKEYVKMRKQFKKRIIKWEK